MDDKQMYIPYLFIINYKIPSLDWYKSLNTSSLFNLIKIPKVKANELWVNFQNGKLVDFLTVL